MKDKKDQDLSRRAMLKTAGVVGVGMAALPSLNPAQAFANQNAAQQAHTHTSKNLNPLPENIHIPGNPVLTEFLFDPDTGEILAMCPNLSGTPRLSTSSETKNDWVFENFDHGKSQKEERETGILSGGAKGKYQIKNGRVQTNPHAAKTISNSSLTNSPFGEAK